MRRVLVDRQTVDVLCRFVNDRVEIKRIQLVRPNYVVVARNIASLLRFARNTRNRFIGQVSLPLALEFPVRIDIFDDLDSLRAIRFLRACRSQW